MFLDKLTQKELGLVEAAGVPHSYPAGDTIIREGANGSSFSLILSGRVEVRKRLAVGEYKALVELGAGDLIGELGFLGSESRTANVVAISDCELLEFDQKSFQKVVDDHPAIGSRVYRGIAEILALRLAGNDETLMDTIFWALGRSPNRTPTVDINIASRPKLVIKPEQHSIAPPGGKTPDPEETKRPYETRRVRIL